MSEREDVEALAMALERGVPQGPAAIHFCPWPGCVDLWESEASCVHALALAAHDEAVRVSERVRLAGEVERGDGLEAMCDRLAGSHVDLQDAVAWALNEAVAWRDRMPRTRENDTYPNGRQDGVDVVVRVVKSAVSAHLRGEDPAALVPVPGVRLTEEE